MQMCMHTEMVNVLKLMLAYYWVNSTYSYPQQAGVRVRGLDPLTLSYIMYNIYVHVWPISVLLCMGCPLCSDTYCMETWDDFPYILSVLRARYCFYFHCGCVLWDMLPSVTVCHFQYRQCHTCTVCMLTYVEIHMWSTYTVMHNTMGMIALIFQSYFYHCTCVLVGSVSYWVMTHH